MFSTFTGNSRRPRNVNLSGQVSNPFSNTTWSPSNVSGATKTVSDAQAEREKRLAERQRLKAAGNIQRAWRGHRARRSLHDARRSAFDDIYRHADSSQAEQRLPMVFSLLLSFFQIQRSDDVQRLLLLVRDSQSVDLAHIAPAEAHPSRIHRLVDISVKALDKIASEDPTSKDLQSLLRLIGRVSNRLPESTRNSIIEYYAALSKMCRARRGAEWPELLADAVAAPLSTDAEPRSYEMMALHFLTSEDISLSEKNVDLFTQRIKVDKLAEAILGIYSSPSAKSASTDDLLRLLAHFIALGRTPLSSSQEFLYLNTLYTQISALSSEIRLRIDIKPISGSSSPQAASLLQPLDPYVSDQLSSLVDHDGISRLLRDFSRNLAKSSNQEFEGTSLLAGYILALLQSFPSKADDTRMRLFLGQIPTTAGEVPTVKFLWQLMRQTSVFRKLKTESDQGVTVLRRYLRGAPNSSNSALEEHEWRIILLFLEIYIFMLILSDDEDFFSGIYPQLLESDSAPSRIRSCSLSLPDVEVLTSFLKNTAFTLHYKAQQISQGLQTSDTTIGQRLNSAPAKLDLDSLRGIVTTALKMLYERDSRKQFLPVNHWLMTDKLDNEGFINAVIAEEERRLEEQEAETTDEEDEDELMTGYPANMSAGIFSTSAGQRVSRNVQLERLKSQQAKSQRDRRLAELGPKLEVLKHMPFVVPFETRVTIFRQFIQLDRLRRDDMLPGMHHPFAKHQAKIRRGRLFEDAFDQFYQLGDGIKDPIGITFVDQFGTPEAGIDGGGVTKEFLTSVTSEAFSSAHNGDTVDSVDFTSNEKGLLYPDPTATDRLRERLRRRNMSEADPEWREEMTALLKRFEFLGRIIGKCMYEGILVDLAFAGFFLLKWSSSGTNEENSYKGSINDLRDMDEDLYKGMLRLKNHPGDVSELGIDFTINDQISGPGEPIKTVSRKLIPNGDQIIVNNDNRPLYLSYTARHRLVVQPGSQTSAFLHGLRTVIQPTWLNMFNQSELQRLVGGDLSEIDLEDLQNNTVYSGLYEIGDDNLEHPTIQLFWKVMQKFTDAQRRDVLKYVSSTPRAPLLGFSQLRPQFSIRDAGTDESRLPSASTCVNLLKLPRYTKESTLRDKLLYAISSGAGFDLS